MSFAFPRATASSASSVEKITMKVSVVIPAYNAEATIAEALESVFAQRFDGGFEVIVINDQPTARVRCSPNSAIGFG